MLDTRNNLPSVVDDEDINKVPNLIDLDFQDIYFNRNGEAMMKGLETRFLDKTPPIVGIPRGVQYEVSGLIQKTFEIGDAKLAQLGADNAHDRFFMEFRNIRYRVQKMIGTVDGEWYTVRRTRQPFRFNSIDGISPIVRQTLLTLCAPRRDGMYGGSGLILFVGETASGKTATGLSLLQEALIVHGDVAVGMEDPVEIMMSGGYGRNNHGRFFQHETHGKYAASMEMAMRETPRYIYLGEIRGPEAAKAAIAASLNGHIVISTMHAGSPIEAIDRLIYLSGDKEIARNNVASGLAAIIHQDLLRHKGKQGKYLRQKCLFFSSDTGVRGKIREDITHQLTTNIEQQSNRIARGEMPISFEKDDD